MRSSVDEDMGRIVDIIVSRDGQIHAAIVDFGGLLGIGTRKIAVDWRALNFAPAGKPGAIILELTRNQVRLAPEYRRGEPVVVVAARPTADVGDDRAVAERPQPGSIIARVRTFPLAWLQHSSARGHRSAANRWTALATTCSIQAKGISPDIEVLQEVPEELKARTDTSGEASLRGHLKAEGDEQTGSQSYIPPDPQDDKALHTALDLIRDIQKNSAYPPNPKTGVPN